MWRLYVYLGSRVKRTICTIPETEPRCDPLQPGHYCSFEQFQPAIFSYVEHVPAHRRDRITPRDDPLTRKRDHLGEPRMTANAVRSRFEVNLPEAAMLPARVDDSGHAAIRDLPDGFHAFRIERPRRIDLPSVLRLRPSRLVPAGQSRTGCDTCHGKRAQRLLTDLAIRSAKHDDPPVAIPCLVRAVCDCD